MKSGIAQSRPARRKPVQTGLCLSFSCPGLACHQALGRRGEATLKEEAPQAACRAGGL